MARRSRIGSGSANSPLPRNPADRSAGRMESRRRLPSGGSVTTYQGLGSASLRGRRTGPAARTTRGSAGRAVWRAAGAFARASRRSCRPAGPCSSHTDASALNALGTACLPRPGPHASAVAGVSLAQMSNSSQRSPVQREAPDPLPWWRWFLVVAFLAASVVLAVVNAGGHEDLWITGAGVTLFVLGHRFWQDWRHRR